MEIDKIQQTPLLELELLKTLVAIADTGNFSQAAISISRTPSAVSMQIKRLEEMTGKTLFTRDSRSVLLTADGEVLLEHGRRMLALNQDMISRFMDSDIQGTVKLGATDDAAQRLLPIMLKRLATAHSGINVKVVVDNSATLQEKFRNKELDLCLRSSTIDFARESGAEVVLREPLVWAGVENGVAWEQDPLPISIWNEGCSWRSVALESLKKSKRKYRIAFSVSHLSDQREAMLADLAIALIPLASCDNDIVRLDKEHRIPGLDDYVLALDIAAKPTLAVSATANHLRTNLHVKH